MRATFVGEPEGSVLVHGIARAEVARIAIQELLLTLGMSEENLTMEMGGMLYSQHLIKKARHHLHRKGT